MDDDMDDDDDDNDPNILAERERIERLLNAVRNERHTFCPNVGCSWSFSWSRDAPFAIRLPTLERHMESCPFRRYNTISCEARGCDWTDSLPRGANKGAALARHMESCPYTANLRRPDMDDDDDDDVEEEENAASTQQAGSSSVSAASTHQAGFSSVSAASTHQAGSSRPCSAQQDDPPLASRTYSTSMQHRFALAIAASAVASSPLAATAAASHQPEAVGTDPPSPAEH
jgi:hypothetical protein